MLLSASLISIATTAVSVFVSITPLLDRRRRPVNDTEAAVLHAVPGVFAFPEVLPDIGGLIAGVLIESKEIDSVSDISLDSRSCWRCFVNAK